MDRVPLHSSYRPITDDDSDADSLDIEYVSRRQQLGAIALTQLGSEKPRWKKGCADPTWRFCSRLFAILALISSVALTAALFAYLGNMVMPINNLSYTDRRIRREWRSLTINEQQNYIESVQCIQNLPSELVGRGNFYDDLVYVHYLVGSQTHGAASFLPWHRAFLHIYESLLTERCGLTIPLPYWNWELDHQSLETASIWSPITGFGGDGSADLAEGLGHGRCVVNGPFANVTRLYWEGEEHPHCLGRSFKHFEKGEIGKMSGGWFTPEKIGIVQRSEGYFEFEDRIEGTIHNAIHWSLRGEMASKSAANDPIFWLHHVQLDRLWWKWQLERPDTRFTDYEGISLNTSAGRKKEARLGDTLEFLDLWKDIRVSEVMKTEGSVLCYRY